MQRRGEGGAQAVRMTGKKGPHARGKEGRSYAQSAVFLFQIFCAFSTFRGFHGDQLPARAALGRQKDRGRPGLRGDRRAAGCGTQCPSQGRACPRPTPATHSVLCHLLPRAAFASSLFVPTALQVQAGRQHRHTAQLLLIVEGAWSSKHNLWLRGGRESQALG